VWRFNYTVSTAGCLPLKHRKGNAPVLTRVGGKSITYSGLSHIFDRWLPARLEALAEVTGEDTALHLYAHRLRHTFAIMLVREDTDLRTVQEGYVDQQHPAELSRDREQAIVEARSACDRRHIAQIERRLLRRDA
jgi:hypothetical protein